MYRLSIAWQAFQNLKMGPNRKRNYSGKKYSKTHYISTKEAGTPKRKTQQNMWLSRLQWYFRDVSLFYCLPKENERAATASTILLHDQMRYALSISHLKYTLISVQVWNVYFNLKELKWSIWGKNVNSLRSQAKPI